MPLCRWDIHTVCMPISYCWYCFVTTVKNNPVNGGSQESFLRATICASTPDIPWFSAMKTPLFLSSTLLALAHVGYRTPGCSCLAVTHLRDFEKSPSLQKFLTLEWAEPGKNYGISRIVLESPLGKCKSQTGQKACQGREDTDFVRWSRSCTPVSSIWPVRDSAVLQRQHTQHTQPLQKGTCKATQPSQMSVSKAE